MLRAIWRLSQPGTFIPIGRPAGPLSCAPRARPASPRTTTRPFAEGERQALERPAAETCLLVVDAVDRRVRELQEGDAPIRPLERLAGEGEYAVDPLGVVAALDDRVFAQELVRAFEGQPGPSMRWVKGHSLAHVHPKTPAELGCGRTPPAVLPPEILA